MFTPERHDVRVSPLYYRVELSQKALFEKRHHERCTNLAQRGAILYTHPARGKHRDSPLSIPEAALLNCPVLSYPRKHAYGSCPISYWSVYVEPELMFG